MPITIFLSIISIQIWCLESYKISLISRRILSPQHNRLFSMSGWREVSTSFVTVGDFSQEIESAVGSEIYGPIFRAGLFLFVSGMVSAFIAGLIVNSADSWEELSLEVDRGKEAKLIPDVMKESDIKEGELLVTAEPISNVNVADEIRNLDL